MKRQRGYIDIPGWFFWMIPIGAILLAIEAVRLLWWLYDHVEVVLK